MYPDASQWRLLLGRNRAALVALPTRLPCRQEILDQARQYTRDVIGAAVRPKTSGPLIVTGHQAIWHHCGIWAKDVATRRLADSCHGTALHIVLDHDTCPTALVVPGRNMGEGCQYEQLEFEETDKHVAIERRPSPDIRFLRRFIDAVGRAPGSPFCHDVWTEEFNRIEAACAARHTVADVITLLQALTDERLGRSPLLYLPVSSLAETEAFTQFAALIISDANTFHHAYNQGRQLAASSGPSGSRSIRCLRGGRGGDAVELPFWLLTPEGRRWPLCVRSDVRGCAHLGTSGRCLGSLKAGSSREGAMRLRHLLGQHGCCLRPRAVTLTLFCRLSITDWFVHGVGALDYEPLTDYMIREYYGLQPPQYGIATGTMYLSSVGPPGDSPDEDPVRLRARLRHVRFHPELYLDAETRGLPSVGSLVAVKQTQIARSRNRTSSRDERRAAWRAIHRINEILGEYVHDTFLQVKTRLAEAEAAKELTCQQVSREFFFGLFPQRALRDFANTASFGESVGNFATR